jgi:sulfatase maturation enzyme AslB (radical SAM superfamily)
MEITTSGKAFACCPSWTKLSLGSLKRKTIRDVWNSRKARHIRRKMYQGQWKTICSPVCPNIQYFKRWNRPIHSDRTDTSDYITPFLLDELKEKKDFLESSPTVFALSNSKVCNLSCIMCERKSQKDNPRLVKRTMDDIITHLPKARKLVLTGMGEPLARPDTRDLLINFRNSNPFLKFDIITNGLLLPQYWEDIKHQRYHDLLISVDAATKESYERIRTGGSWENLLKSLALVRENMNTFHSVTLNMTVMRQNYREIPAFIDFADSFGFHVSFQRIRGKHGDQNFFEDGDAMLLDVLKDMIAEEQVKTRNVTVFWGDLSDFLASGNEAVSRSDRKHLKRYFDRFKTYCEIGFGR